MFKEYFQETLGAPKPGSKWTSSLAGPTQHTPVSLFRVLDIAEPLATELDSSDKDSELKQIRAEQLALQKKIAAKEVSSFQSYANIALFSF